MKRCIALAFACVLAAAAADVTGNWNVTAQTAGGREYKMELVLRQQEGKLAGTMSSPAGSVELQKVKLESDQLSYELPVGENTYAIKLTVAGDAMKGNFTGPDGSGGTVVAQKAAAAEGGVAGTWKAIANSSGGQQYNVTLELKLADGKVTGTLTTSDGMSLPIQDARLEGKDLRFRIVVDEGAYTIKVTQQADQLQGTYSGPGGETGKVTATR